MSSEQDEAGGAFIGPTIEAPVWELIKIPCSPPKLPRQIAVSPEEKAEIKRSLHAYHADPTVEWTGFFTDLLFVAVIVRFALQMKHMIDHEVHDEAHGTRLYFEGLLWFAGFYVIWFELAVIESRFINLPGVWDDICLFVFCAGVLVMSVQLDDEQYLTANRVGFVWGFMTCLTSLLILYILYYRSIPRARPYCQRRIITTITSIFLCSLYLICDHVFATDDAFGQYACYVILGPVFLYHILFEANSYRVLGEELLNFEQTVNRFGLLVMVVSGESILAIILGLEDTDLTMSDYETIFFSFAVIYQIKDIYFNSCCGMKGHALIEHESPGSVMWAFIHFPLAYSLFLVGVGFKLFFHVKDEDHNIKALEYRAIVVVAITFCMIFGLSVRTAHRFYTFPWQSWFIRGIIILIIPIGMMFLNVTFLLLWCLICIALNNVMDYVLIDYTHLEIHKDYLDSQEQIVSGIRATAAADEDTFRGNQDEQPPYLLIWDYFAGNLMEDEHDHHEMISHRTHEAHGDDHDHEADRSHGWFNEFCDLILAAIIVKFADYLKHNTLESRDKLEDAEKLVAESIVAFMGYWVCWLELTATTTRFRNIEGVTDDIFYFVYLSGLILMAVQLNPHGFIFDDASGYILGYLICLSTSMWLHIFFHMQLPNAKKYCLWRVVTYALAIAVLLVGMYVDNYFTAFFSVLCSSLCVMFVSVNSYRTHEGVHRTFHETIERFGAFVMILTGESILALALMHESLEAYAYACLITALAIMFLLKNVYFYGNVGSEDGHALCEAGTPGSCVWVLAHGVLGYFLLCVGVSLKLFFTFVGKRVYEPYYGYLLTGSLFACLWVMYAIRAAHEAFIFPIWSFLIRLPLTALLLVGVPVIDDSFGLLIWCAVLMAAYNYLDILMEYFEHPVYKKDEYLMMEHTEDFTGNTESEPIRMDEAPKHSRRK